MLCYVDCNKSNFFLPALTCGTTGRESASQFAPQPLSINMKESGAQEHTAAPSPLGTSSHSSLCIPRRTAMAPVLTCLLGWFLLWPDQPKKFLDVFDCCRVIAASAAAATTTMKPPQVLNSFLSIFFVFFFFSSHFCRRMII